MKRIQIFYPYLVLGLMLMILAPTHAATTEKGNFVTSCDILWSKFQHQIDEKKMPIPYRAAEWAKLESKCADKSEFRMRMVMLHLDNNDFASARKDAQGIQIGSKERRHADLLIGYGDQWALVNDPRKVDYKLFEKKYQQLTEDFPDWYIGFESLAQFSLYAQDFISAERASLRATYLAPDSNAYSMLAVSSYLTGKYEQAVNAGNRALEIDPSLNADLNLMLRLSASYYAMHRANAAKDVLARLVKANPDAESSPAYRQVDSMLNQPESKGRHAN